MSDETCEQFLTRICEMTKWHDLTTGHVMMDVDDIRRLSEGYNAWLYGQGSQVQRMNDMLAKICNSLEGKAEDAQD